MTPATEPNYPALGRDIKPFVKWAGGKRNLAAQIILRMPPGRLTYHEPFVGGGAVFFELYKRKRVDHAFLADQNQDVVNALVVIKKDVRALISALEQHALLHQKHGAEHYYKVRDAFDDKASDVERAARFIYLNRTCFNGLYRVNKSGRFNVPVGDYKNPTICDAENLRAAHEALQHATVAMGDFEPMMDAAKPGHVCYADPPYLPVKRASKKDGIAATSFTAYDKTPFGVAEHQRLADAFTRAANRGVHVILSNSDVALIRDMYKLHRVEEVRAPRAVNSDGAGRGEVTELLITGRRR